MWATQDPDDTEDAVTGPSADAYAALQAPMWMLLLGIPLAMWCVCSS